MADEVWIKLSVDALRYGGGTTWDGGTTVWDGGTTIWDVVAIPTQIWNALENQ